MAYRVHGLVTYLGPTFLFRADDDFLSIPILRPLLCQHFDDFFPTTHSLHFTIMNSQIIEEDDLIEDAILQKILFRS